MKRKALPIINLLKILCSSNLILSRKKLPTGFFFFIWFGTIGIVTAQDNPALAEPDTMRIDTNKIVENKHFQDLNAATTKIKIKGYVKLNTFYDFNGIKNTEGFNPYEILIDSFRNSQLQGFYVGARQSRLGFEANFDSKLGRIETYIEGDFAGDATGLAFRLRHAYGKINYWTLGHTWSTFTDLEALPQTVDRDGPNSGLYVRTGLIRFETKFGEENNEVGASIENPRLDFVNTFDTSSVTLQRDFDLVGRLKIKTSWGHVQLGVVTRILTFLQSTGTFDFQPGGGGMLTSQVRTHKKGTFYFSFAGGIGISSYIGGLDGKKEDGFVGINDNLSLLPVTALYAAYEVKWGKKLTSTFIWGDTRIYNKMEQTDFSFHNSRYFAGNIFWQVTRQLDVAVEIAWGDRKNKNDRTNSALRVQLMGQFNF